MPQDPSPHASLRLGCGGLPACLHRRLPLPRTTLKHTLRSSHTPRRLRDNRHYNRVLLYAKSTIDLPSGREQVASR
jgi:hypothetical protein